MENKEISRKNIQNVIQLMSFIHFLADIQHVLEIQQLKDVPCYYLKFGYFSDDTAMIQKIMNTNMKGQLLVVLVLLIAVNDSWVIRSISLRGCRLPLQH